jgi:ACT domain-containing protein
MTTGLGAILPWPHEGSSLPACVSCVEQERRSNQNRAIITATGPNRRGVIATLTKCIADAEGDIQDVSQTIISDFFTLIFVVDLRHVSIDFAEFKQRVCAAADALGIHAVVMHEDVMRALQRV